MNQHLTIVWSVLFLMLSSVLQARTFDTTAKNNCQLADEQKQTVTLIFCPDSNHFNFPVDSIVYISAYGSISEWGEKTPGYTLDSVSEDGCYYRSFTYEQVGRPGNSGQPEFMFYIETIDSAYYLWPDTLGVGAIDKRLLFVNNEITILILLPGGPDYFTTNRDELYARCLEAQTVRPLSDYDFTDTMEQHRICNFRLTPGTTCLYRSYHPYYPDKPQYDTEVMRLHWVKELAERVSIKSDITLSSNQEASVGSKYECNGDSFQITMPTYHRQLIDRGDILYVGKKYGGHPSTGQCYYHSEDTYFAKWFAEVVEFIIDERHPLPIQIHCALGADRTGMFCATIAALCEVDWQTIITDYAETGNMKIQTYRHPNRLYYAFQRMIGEKPDTLTTQQLSAAVKQHFIDMKVLTDQQIQRMVKRLNSPITTSLDFVDYHPTPTTTYDLLGRPVSNSYKGMVIKQGILMYNE